MEFENGRALVIGIANYRDVPSLPEAVLNDARDISAVLQTESLCGFAPSKVKLLLDDEATLTGIRDALAGLASEAKESDTVVIFFSGHGARIGSGALETSALVPFDCAKRNLQQSTIPEREFSSALQSIKARRLLVLIDACHAGGAGQFKSDLGGEVNFGFGEKSLDRLAQGTGRVIIASSRASETSLVLGGARNSVFTDQLVRALKGQARTAGDGLIRVFEVFNFVSEQVRRAVPGRQHPIFKASDLEDNFPISLDGGGSKSPATSPLAQQEWRDLENIMADLYPEGPTDQAIWTRAGGDVSRLSLAGTGRAKWFAALRTLKLGGGGRGMTRASLIEASLEDYPHHVELLALRNESAGQS
ncbi:caspase family protein [Bradyrhizobium sp. WSM 1738]|uniref:caspase family protein n=1 Tax=Bradyrhizobium hereditatis TaxID=2821405 RepID=UPI001CE2EB4C|nr:caspase family protein [Bradyrhizobium hereditatis]MCA6115199.1 caspase family protein [Bradyrhizobium hereditatis]